VFLRWRKEMQNGQVDFVYARRAVVFRAVGKETPCRLREIFPYYITNDCFAPSYQEGDLGFSDALP